MANSLEEFGILQKLFDVKFDFGFIIISGRKKNEFDLEKLSRFISYLIDKLNIHVLLDFDISNDQLYDNVCKNNCNVTCKSFSDKKFFSNHKSLSNSTEKYFLFIEKRLDEEIKNDIVYKRWERFLSSYLENRPKRSGKLLCAYFILNDSFESLKFSLNFVNEIMAFSAESNEQDKFTFATFTYDFSNPKLTDFVKCKFEGLLKEYKNQIENVTPFNDVYFENKQDIFNSIEKFEYTEERQNSLRVMTIFVETVNKYLRIYFESCFIVSNYCKCKDYFKKREQSIRQHTKYHKHVSTSNEFFFNEQQLEILFDSNGIAINDFQNNKMIDSSLVMSLCNFEIKVHRSYIKNFIFIKNLYYKRNKCYGHIGSLSYEVFKLNRSSDNIVNYTDNKIVKSIVDDLCELHPDKIDCILNEVKQWLNNPMSPKSLKSKEDSFKKEVSNDFDFQETLKIIEPIMKQISEKQLLQLKMNKEEIKEDIKEEIKKIRADMSKLESSILNVIRNRDEYTIFSPSRTLGKPIGANNAIKSPSLNNQDLKDFFRRSRKNYIKILVLTQNSLFMDSDLKTKIVSFIIRFRPNVIIDLNPFCESKDKGGLFESVYSEDKTSQRFSIDSLMSDTRESINFIQDGKLLCYIIANGSYEQGEKKIEDIRIKNNLFNFFEQLFRDTNQNSKNCVNFILFDESSKNAYLKDNDKKTQINLMIDINQVIKNTLSDESPDLDTIYLLNEFAIDINKLASKDYIYRYNINEIDELITTKDSSKISESKVFFPGLNEDGINEDINFDLESREFSSYKNLFRYYDINAGKMKKPSDKRIFSAAVEFLKGNKINAETISLNENHVKYKTYVKRNLISKVENAIRDRLNSKKPLVHSNPLTNVFKIYHLPSGGGTTVGHILLYNLRKEYPCVEIIPKKNIERANVEVIVNGLDIIAKKTRKTIVILMDGVKFPYVDEDDLFLMNVLKDKPFKSIIISIVRGGAESTRSGKFRNEFFLNFEKNEKDQFNHLYNIYFPGENFDNINIDSIHHYRLLFNPEYEIVKDLFEKLHAYTSEALNKRYADKISSLIVLSSTLYSYALKDVVLNVELCASFLGIKSNDIVDYNPKLQRLKLKNFLKTSKQISNNDKENSDNNGEENSDNNDDNVDDDDKNLELQCLLKSVNYFLTYKKDKDCVGYQPFNERTGEHLIDCIVKNKKMKNKVELIFNEIKNLLESINNNPNFSNFEDLNNFIFELFNNRWTEKQQRYAKNAAENDESKDEDDQSDDEDENDDYNDADIRDNVDDSNQDSEKNFDKTDTNYSRLINKCEQFLIAQSYIQIDAKSEIEKHLRNIFDFFKKMISNKKNFRKDRSKLETICAHYGSFFARYVFFKSKNVPECKYEDNLENAKKGISIMKEILQIEENEELNSTTITKLYKNKTIEDLESILTTYGNLTRHYINFDNQYKTTFMIDQKQAFLKLKNSIDEAKFAFKESIKINPLNYHSYLGLIKSNNQLLEYIFKYYCKNDVIKYRNIISSNLNLSTLIKEANNDLARSIEKLANLIDAKRCNVSKYLIFDNQRKMLEYALRAFDDVKKNKLEKIVEISENYAFHAYDYLVTYYRIEKRKKINWRKLEFADLKWISQVCLKRVSSIHNTSGLVSQKRLSSNYEDLLNSFIYIQKYDQDLTDYNKKMQKENKQNYVIDLDNAIKHAYNWKTQFHRNSFAFYFHGILCLLKSLQNGVNDKEKQIWLNNGLKSIKKLIDMSTERKKNNTNSKNNSDDIIEGNQNVISKNKYRFFVGEEQGLKGLIFRWDRDWQNKNLKLFHGYLMKTINANETSYKSRIDEFKPKNGQDQNNGFTLSAYFNPNVTFGSIESENKNKKFKYNLLFRHDGFYIHNPTVSD